MDSGSNPAAKIVLWRTTGTWRRVQHDGSELRHMYGNQMVGVGFAFEQGSFQAIEQRSGLCNFTVNAAPVGSFDATLADGFPSSRWISRIPTDRW